MRINVRSRNAISAAISAMFVIAIFFVIVMSLFMYTMWLNNYNQVVNERSKMDWDRISEHITFNAAAVGTNGILNISFFNDGGVTLHLVQTWFSEYTNSSYVASKYQRQYWIDKYVSPGETVPSLGYYSEFRKVTSNGLDPIAPLSGLSSTGYYKIKLVTERGNAFECQVPYPPPSQGGGATSAYELVVVSSYNNFQYVCGSASGHPIESDWKWAYVHQKVDNNYGDSRVIYRILLKNTTPRRIYFHPNSTMLQLAYSSGGELAKYIISPTTRMSDTSPTRLSINGAWVDPEGTIQLWFAWDSKYGWNGDPSTQAFYVVGFVLCWRYTDEPSTWRYISLPSFVQQLT